MKLLQTSTRSLILLYIILSSLTTSGQTQLTNLPTLWITTNGNAAITSKDKWVNGQLTTLSTESDGIYNGEIEIRGRGNSTWGMEKKPYRLRLKQKFNLLGMPAKERNWVLLANFADKTLLRNAITFEMSQYIGMPFSNHYRLVDVYLNGDYIGNYTLTDHVQVADTRIIAEELEPEDTTLPDISGGYLLEIDGTATSEPVYFITGATATPITIKYPDEETINDEQKSYINQFVNDFERVLFSENFKDSENGFWKYVDKNSLINWYIACELSGNSDSFWSTYLVKRRNDNKIYFGPLWDFDIAYDNDRRIYKAPFRHVTDFGFGYRSWIQQILKDDKFRKAVHTRWNELKNQGFTNHILQKIDYLKTQINSSQAKNYEKWNTLGHRVYLEPQIRNTYTDEFNYLKNYITHRHHWFDIAINGIDPNSTYKIVNRNSGKALSLNANNQAIQLTYNNLNSQKWQLLWNEQIAAFQIINSGNGLALQGNYQSPSQLVAQNSDSNHPGQNWNFSLSDENNIFVLTSRLGFSIDNQNLNHDSSPVNHSKRTINHGPQEWIITKIEDSTPEDCQYQINTMASQSNVSCNEDVILSAECVGNNCDNITYQWGGNGLNTTGNTATVRNSMNGTYSYTVNAIKNGCPSVVKTVTVTVTGCTEQPVPTQFSQCVEAEFSEGTGTVTSDPNASSGKTRGIIATPNYYVDYKLTDVPKTGVYQVTLHYSAESSPSIQVMVNGGVASSLNLPATHSWNIVFNKTTFNVTLHNGENIIRIHSTGTSSIRQDKICVEGNVDSEIPEQPQEPTCNFDITASVTKTNPACGESVTLSANCSGTDCNNVTYQWSGNNFQHNAGTANVSHNSNGNYTYTLTATKAGCAPKSKTVALQVNGCNSGEQPIAFNQCVEAETSQGSGPISDDPNASAGKTRGSQQQSNHYVDYMINNVPTNGLFQVKLRYSTNGAAQAKVSVNGGSEQTISLTPTFSWNIVFNEATFNINLNQGNNTIRISGYGNNSIRQDKICVSGSGNPNTPQPSSCNFAIDPTASKNNPNCTEAVTLAANCSGADCSSVSYQWSGNNLSSNQASPSIAQNSNGSFEYKVIASKNGCSSIEKTLTVTVNGCDNTTPQPPVNFNACIESENATGSGEISADPNASAGKTRGSVASPNHSVDYNINNVPADGTYQVTLRYSAEYNAQVKVSVNTTQNTIPLTATSSWNIVFNEKRFNVNLKAGNNVLRIEGVGNISTRQDKICVNSLGQQSSARKIDQNNEQDTQPSYFINELTLAPNPATTYVKTSFTLVEGENGTLTLNDLHGQIIQLRRIKGTGSVQTETIFFNDTKPGLYLIRLNSNSNSQVKKLIIIP